MNGVVRALAPRSVSTRQMRFIESRVTSFVPHLLVSPSCFVTQSNHNNNAFRGASVAPGCVGFSCPKENPQKRRVLDMPLPRRYHNRSHQPCQAVSGDSIPVTPSIEPSSRRCHVHSFYL